MAGTSGDLKRRRRESRPKAGGGKAVVGEGGTGGGWAEDGIDSMENKNSLYDNNGEETWLPVVTSKNDIKGETEKAEGYKPIWKPRHAAEEFREGQFGREDTERDLKQIPIEETAAILLTGRLIDMPSEKKKVKRGGQGRLGKERT